MLHVSETTDGGVGAFVEALAADQAAHGLQVAVAAPSAGPAPARLRAAGVRFLPWEAVPQPGPALPGELLALARVLRTAAPDVVHLHSSKAGLAGRLLLRRRRPTVTQPHAWSFLARTGAVRRATLAWERLGARWSDAVLCVGEDERRIGEAAGIRAPFRVLPNGIDLARFTAPADDERPAARAALGLPDAPLAVCVGRLHRQKHQAALLDAWPAVRARVPGAELALVGDGPDRAELEARAVEGVRLAGAQADVRPWLVAADVVAQPSRWEGLSLSLLEALGTARPVVVTDVPGMREVAGDDAGAVVPPGDTAALARAVADRLADPRLAAAEGRAGRRRVEARHDRRRQFDGISALYEELALR